MSNRELIFAPDFYSYFVARDRLIERLGATEREVAAWVFFGEIAAHWIASPQEAESGFTYGLVDGRCPERNADEPEYITRLAGSRFTRDVIDSFLPKHRYVSFPDLVNKWSLKQFCGTSSSAAKAIFS